MTGNSVLLPQNPETVFCFLRFLFSWKKVIYIYFFLFVTIIYLLTRESEFNGSVTQLVTVATKWQRFERNRGELHNEFKRILILATFDGNITNYTAKKLIYIILEQNVWKMKLLIHSFWVIISKCFLICANALIESPISNNRCYKLCPKYS